MTEIRRIRRDNVGTILKQGDMAEVHFSLYDAENGNDSGILNQPAEVVFLQDETVVYTTSGQVDDMYMCKFRVEAVLPAGLYHVEFIVNGGIYPSGDKPYFTITKSSRGADANIIQAYGFDDVVKRVVSEVTHTNLATKEDLAQIQKEHNEVTAQLAQTKQAFNDSVSLVTEDSEVILARDGHATLNARLDSEKARLEASKADKVVLKNLVEKGNFIDGNQIVGATPITPSRDLLSVENGRLKVTSATYAKDLGFYIRGISIPKNHKVYLYANLDFPSTKEQNISIRATVPSTVTLLTTTFSSDGNSQLSTTNADLSSFYITLSGTKDQGEHYYFVNSIIIMDLTETFGAGNEPSKEEMDELIKVIGYIDGEYALNNKEMLVWILKLIRRNTSAIIALGGNL